MNYLDRDYQKLLQDILEKGVDKTDRTGTGTKSIFGRQIRHNMQDGFPLLTTKKVHWESIVTELLWFLRGDTNIKYLVDNGCHIWDGDFYKNYSTYIIEEWNSGAINELFEDNLIIEESNGSKDISYRKLTQEEFINKIKTDDEFAKKWGELGPIYGAQWRSWEKCELTNDDDFGNNESWGDWNIKQIDQIANSINLLKTDPDSRRNKVSAWNVGELDQMTLPPCHTDFQFYTRELSLEERYDLIEKDKYTQFVKWQDLGTDRIKEVLDEKNIPTRTISLMWNQRSVDTFLGLPFNIASYGLLLEIIAKEVNMVPDDLIGNLGDVHLYNNHIEQAKEQIGRTSFELPTLKHKTHLDGFKSWLFDETYGGIILRPKDFILENYQSHLAIKAPLSN
jgi:thymidylate synthase